MLNTIKEKINKASARIKASRLDKQARYVPGFLEIDGYKINYQDSAATFHDYKDIMKRGIYNFRATMDTPYIIDAGSYIGISVLHFKRLYPQAEVIAFEPDPAIFSILKKNIQMNNLDHVRLFNAGLGKTDSSFDFYLDSADGGSCFQQDVANKKPIKVDIVRLSNFIDKPVDLLKMNIEGMEADVIEEITPKLHLVKEIIFEYHMFHNLKQSLGSILTTLDKAGFRYLLNDETSQKINVPFNMPKNYRCFNLVYAKNTNYPELWT